MKEFSIYGHNPNKKLQKSFSETRILKKDCSFKDSIQNDPFRLILPTFPKTPALKPTCHKNNSIYKSFFSPESPEKSCKNLDKPKVLKITSSLIKTSYRPKVTLLSNPVFSQRIVKKKKKLFNKTNFNSILNPSLYINIENSRKNREIERKSTKAPSLSTKVMKRVNSLVFKDKKMYRERNSLDFSFGDPIPFI